MANALGPTFLITHLSIFGQSIIPIKRSGAVPRLPLKGVFPVLGSCLHPTKSIELQKVTMPVLTLQIRQVRRKHGHGVCVADVVQGRSLGGICRRLHERKPERYSQMEDQGAFASTESRSKILILANIKDEDVEDRLACLAGSIVPLCELAEVRSKDG